MCLLHTHHKDTILDKEWIEDFYDINSDGIGVMYSEVVDSKAHLVIKKCLPKNYEEAQAFYDAEIKGRECVVHWRMATHGDVDFDNCHPYILLPLDSSCPMAIMHNGVLSNGNYKDKSKSDTWHYMNDFLIPLLDPQVGGDPNLIFKEPFIEILGDSIGNSNKFVAMDYLGNVTIVNRHAGVNWNGIWLSNTYAWTAPGRLSRGKYNYTSTNYQDADWGGNKYYGAAYATPNDDLINEHDPRLDYLDRPMYTHRWEKGVERVGKSAGLLKDTSVGNKKKKGKQGKGVVIVDHKGEVKDVIHGAPTNTLGKGNAVLLEEEKQVEEMFDLLDDEGKTKAYTSLSFQNFYKFIDATSLDTCWEAVYMHVDGVIDDTAFIDYILDPKKWTDHPMPVHGRANVGAGGLSQDALDELLARDPDDEVSDEEVISKTLPRHVDNGPLDEDVIDPIRTDFEGHRPIYDQRTNANVFDINKGQRVA